MGIYEIGHCCYNNEWEIWRLMETKSECYVIVYRNCNHKTGLSQDVQTLFQMHLLI